MIGYYNHIDLICDGRTDCSSSVGEVVGGGGSPSDDIDFDYTRCYHGLYTQQ